MAGTKSILEHIWESIQVIISTVDVDHMKLVLRKCFTLFLATVTLAKSQMAASTTVGVNVGQTAYDKIEHLVHGTSFDNKRYLTFVHAACLSLGVYFSFAQQELTVMSSIAMMASHELLRCATMTVLDPISTSVKAPKLSDYPAVLHTAQITIMSIAVACQLNPFSNGSFFGTSTAFYPFIIIDLCLGQLYKTY